MSALQEKFLAFRVHRYQDARAYGQIYDLHFARVRKYIYFKVSKVEDIDELTSEVFLRGWEYMTASIVTTPGALLYRIARNLVADHYRKQERRPESALDEDLAASIPEHGSLEVQVDARSEAEIVAQAIRSLKEEYREVLVMRFLSEMTVPEIASVLGKSSNNVRVLLHRARKALDEKLS